MTKNKYFNFGLTTLYVHLDLECRILTDQKSTKEEEEISFNNIKEIKKIIKRRKQINN
tara:strand:- start:2259 stop:2432 length:174 start_codon:yes stop_codon:yes gene_type:complete